MPNLAFHEQQQPAVPRRAAARRTVCTLRARGLSIRAIAAETGHDRGIVYSMLAGQARGEPSPIPPAANDNRVVRLMPHNGGCSTLSGLVEVSLPRIRTLEQPEIEVAA
jgi:hypothetical protein